jgi:hypothetical protein
MNNYNNFKDMMKKPGKKIIYFCHYPKTGGTFFKNIVFNTHNGIDNITPEIIENSYVAKKLQEKNIYIKLLGHNENYKKYKRSNTFLITTVRHPLELMKSIYSHGRKGMGNILENNDIRNFNDYVNFQLQGKLNNHLIEKYLFKDMFCNNTIIFDLVFKLENIHDDLTNFFLCFDLDISRINFNISDYDKNKFIHDKFENNYPMNHKKERQELIIQKETKDKIKNYYRFFYDYYKYD